MFAVALVLRVAIGPWESFYFDTHNGQLWAGELARVGIHRFYDSVAFSDYPPGYLYFLWVIGKISATPGYLLMKVPAYLGDLGVAWLAGVLASRIAPRSLAQRVPIRALVAAAVLFNPAVLFDSGIFGQEDVVPTFFVLAALVLLLTGRASLGRDASAFALFGFAFLTKPQMCLALPVMLYALYRGYLHRRAGLELLDGVVSVVVIGLTSIGVWLVLALPFGLGPVELVRFYSHSSKVHPYTSSNAFNLWGVLGSWRNDVTGDNVYRVAGIPALYVGLLLFVAALAVALWRMHRAIERGGNEPAILVLGAAVTSLLGYALLTRMHERYMFPAIAFLAPVIFSRPIRRMYWALSLLFLLSLWFPFAYYNSQVPGQVTLKLEPFYGWIFGGFTFDTWQKRLLSLAVLLIAGFLAWRGFDYLRGEPAGEPAEELARAADTPTVPPARTRHDPLEG